jgi:hypothetical protein
MRWTLGVLGATHNVENPRHLIPVSQQLLPEAATISRMSCRIRAMDAHGGLRLGRTPGRGGGHPRFDLQFLPSNVEDTRFVFRQTKGRNFVSAP